MQLHNKLQVMLEAVIDTSDPSKVAAQVTKRAPLLATFAKTQSAFMVLMGCFEELCGVVEPALMKRVPHILQALYDSDAVTEEQLLAWAASPPESSWLVGKEIAAAVRTNAKPFIDWLQEAEEESDEE
jgi:translation initiation factor 5